MIPLGNCARSASLTVIGAVAAARAPMVSSARGRRRRVEGAERRDVGVPEARVEGHESAVVVGRPRAHPLLQRRDRQLEDGVAGHRPRLASRLAPPWIETRVAPPSAAVAALAHERLAGLATPPGALGRVGEIGAWLAAAQGEVPPRPLTDVRLVVFAGDHGVAAHGVSAYPAAVTEAMVRTIVAGRAGVSALAPRARGRRHGPRHRRGRRPRGPAHRGHRAQGAPRLRCDPPRPTPSRATRPSRSLALGAEVARELIDAGAQLLMTGDLGIGNTTPAAALVAATLGLPGRRGHRSRHRHRRRRLDPQDAT